MLYMLYAIYTHAIWRYRMKENCLPWLFGDKSQGETLSSRRVRIISLGLLEQDTDGDGEADHHTQQADEA